MPPRKRARVTEPVSSQSIDEPVSSPVIVIVIECPVIDYTQGFSVLQYIYHPHLCVPHSDSLLHHLLHLKIAATNSVALELQRGLSRLARELCLACPPPPAPSPTLWQEPRTSATKTARPRSSTSRATSGSAPKRRPRMIVQVNDATISDD